MADIDRHEVHTLVDHIPESDMPAARKVLRVGGSRWNWRFWPRPWTTSRRRRKSEAGWRRLWPRNLPTSHLNSSGANRHEASPVPPPGGEELEKLPNRDRDQVEEAIERFSQTGWRRKDADGRGARTEAARGTLASSFHL